MNNAAHTYIQPDTTSTTALPAQVADYLDGTNLLAKTQALRISTVDAEGWPHASLLSAGDMLAMPSGRIRFVVFAQSATTSNLMRDSRLSITLALDGGMCELRLRCHHLSHSSPDAPLALFEAELAEVRNHKAPYATVSGGVTFVLHEPQSVLQRWQKQIAAMRQAA
ncbi:MAG: pyridoxamine 5'-phosphate oxidase family protein [Acetobacteraceae bacterium]